MFEIYPRQSPELAPERPAAYEVDPYPPVDEQRAFFDCAIQQASAQKDTTHYRSGALSPHFESILRQVEVQLHELDPTLSPEHLIPSSYQSLAARKKIAAQTPAFREQLAQIRQFRHHRTERLVQYKLRGHLAGQTLPSDVVDVPPYCQQGASWEHDQAIKTCANACFRMVFSGITGWQLDERAVMESFIEATGSPIVEDQLHHKLFNTEAFSAISDKTVSIVELTGADFTTIATIAATCKKRMPGAQVYAVASLGSETFDPHAWHAAVLLETTDDSVICHDPSYTKGEAYRAIPREAFTDRWAKALNRVQIFVASTNQPIK